VDAESAENAMAQSREIIKEFGRFPNRNKVLGRPTNADEEMYLERAEASKRDKETRKESNGDGGAESPRKPRRTFGGSFFRRRRSSSQPAVAQVMDA
jgi:hypothetical protein